MSAYHLAQVNIGRLIAPMDSPLLRDFVDNLDRINELAEKSPGFVWRMQTEEGNAMSVEAFDDPQIITNMSVWEDVESLKLYVYKSDHLEFVRRRKEWFTRHDGSYFAMWWIPAGHLPNTDEAKERLVHMDKHGETAHAFTFRKVFPAPR